MISDMLGLGKSYTSLGCLNKHRKSRPTEANDLWTWHWSEHIRNLVFCLKYRLIRISVTSWSASSGERPGGVRLWDQAVRTGVG